MSDAPDLAPHPDQPMRPVYDAIDARDPETAREAISDVRARLESGLEGKQLTPGSLILERKRRAHQRLDDLEKLVHSRTWPRADELARELTGAVDRVLEEAKDLPSQPADAPARRLPPWIANIGTVARKEMVVQLQGTQGLVLFGLFLVTFGIGLTSVLSGGLVGETPSVAVAWNYAHSLAFLTAPLAGILLGHSLINEERNSGTIHFLATKPISRAGLATGKWLGMAGALAVLLVASAGIVGGVAYGATGTLGAPGTVVGYVLATYLVALAFASVALTVSAVIDRTGGALVTGFGLYLVLGPLWQNVFLTRSLEDAGARIPLGTVLVYLASPFTAWWNWTQELLGPKSQVLGLPTGEPWHAALVKAVERGTLDALPFYATHPYYAAVIVAWCILGWAATLAALRVRDLA